MRQTLLLDSECSTNTLEARVGHDTHVEEEEEEVTPISTDANEQMSEEAGRVDARTRIRNEKLFRVHSHSRTQPLLTRNRSAL